MNSNVSGTSSEKKATLSLGRLYTFLIALFIIVSEIIYYAIFTDGAKHLEMGGLFIHKFLIEPFNFLASWMGQINFYSISISALGIVIIFLIILFVTISNMIKNNVLKIVSEIIGAVLAVLYVFLMFTGILHAHIEMIFIFIALLLLALDFPYKKLAIASLVIIAWLFSAIISIINPILNSSNIVKSYRLNQNPEANFILKYDTNVSGALHIIDAEKTEILEGLELFIYKSKDTTIPEIFDGIVSSVENNTGLTLDQIIEESNQRNIEKFQEDMVIEREDIELAVNYFYAYHNDYTKSEIIDLMIENGMSSNLSNYYQKYFRNVITSYVQNKNLSILKNKVSFINEDFEDNIQQMTNTVDMFNNFSIERYMEDGIDLDIIGNYMSVELFNELIPEDILPIIMESLRFRVNNVLSSALKSTLVEEYGISKLELRKKPVDFKPITKEFTEFSDEQIINITDLKPFTKYFYYIEAYNKEYPIGIQISEVKNLINKYPIVLPFKKDIYLNRLSDIINNLGGSPDNIEEVLKEWVNGGNISHRETINFLKEFGVDDIPRRRGLKFKTLTKNFNTPIKSIKDEKKPIIVDADMIIEPLDIDFSEFIKENYDGIVNDLQTVSPLEIGQNIIYLGEIWGIPRGTTRKEIEKSNKLYELLGQNADKLISIIPNRDAVNKETSDRFMEEIINIIGSQTTNPNLAEDLKIPAHVKLGVKYDEKCVGTLSVSIDRKKDPLNALSQKDFSYTWEAEFGLMDYQYQGVEEGSDLFEDLDFNKSQFKIPDPQNPYKEILDWDAYIKAYRSAPAKFNIRAYINSDQIIYLNRKYPYSTKPVDIRGNEGSWTEREESGIQTQVTTRSYVDVVNIILTCIILILILTYCIFSINQMKKKFMLKESLPIFLANLGIILIIVNLILSLALNIFPIKLEFFIVISLIFFILSKQMWAVRLTLGIAGIMVVLSLVSIFVQIFPELLVTFRPPVDPNVPASFVSMIPITLIVPIFMYIVSFAVSSNMLINNIGTKRNMVVGWIAIIVLFIASVVTSLIALNMYSIGQESELLRNIAIITGAGFIGTLIGVNVLGDWGKTIGQILFPLLIVGYGIFIIMGFVPIKLPLILILIAYLIIGTPWARSFTILYFFIQAFVLFFSFVILLFETEYQILLKLVLLIIGLIYVVIAIFTIKSKRVKDYSEGKL